MSDYYKNKLILIVDDEVELLEMLTSILKDNGYTNIKTASTCKEAKAVCKNCTPELALLDVMLPDGNGYELIRYFKQTLDFPVLFLTARGEDDDRLRGFELGAEDYIVKPFLPKELLFRISITLKRNYKEEKTRICLPDCEINFDTATIFKEGKELPLTAKEYAILTTLHRNLGRIVTIDSLCEAVWGDNPFGYENSLMAHIRRIREKIEKTPSKPKALITVKGLGYKLLLGGKQDE